MKKKSQPLLNFKKNKKKEKTKEISYDIINISKEKKSLKSR